MILYLVFAITTGICSWLFIYNPVVREAKAQGIVNTFTNNPKLSSIVYIAMSALIAPSIFLPLFNTTQSALMMDALAKEILKQD